MNAIKQLTGGMRYVVLTAALAAALAGCSVVGPKSQACKVDNVAKLVAQGSSVGAFGLSVSTDNKQIGDLVTLSCEDGRREALAFQGYKGVVMEKGGTYQITLEAPDGLGGYYAVREARQGK